jgi:hypothetical protein
MLARRVAGASHPCRTWAVRHAVSAMAKRCACVISVAVSTAISDHATAETARFKRLNRRLNQMT